MSSSHASLFRAMHTAEQPLLLPNAWDAASALIQAQAGAKAVATSSAALSWSLGHRDGGALPLAELVAAVGRIARVLRVPLTVDIEDGFSPQPAVVAQLAEAVCQAGAVGINLEDGEGPAELLAEKIGAIRARVSPAALFINARTDVCLRGLAQGDDAVAMLQARARVYAAAGADGLFVPGFTELAQVAEVAQACSAAPMALNLMALPGMASPAALHAAGVKRLSVGPAMFLSAYGALARDTAAFLAGEVSPMFEQAMGFGEMEGLLA